VLSFFEHSRYFPITVQVVLPYLLVPLRVCYELIQTRFINSSVCGRSADFPNTNTPRVAPVHHSQAARTTLTDFGSAHQWQCEPNCRNGRKPCLRLQAIPHTLFPTNTFYSIRYNLLLHFGLIYPHEFSRNSIDGDITPHSLPNYHLARYAERTVTDHRT